MSEAGQTPFHRFLTGFLGKSLNSRGPQFSQQSHKRTGLNQGCVYFYNTASLLCFSSFPSFLGQEKKSTYFPGTRIYQLTRQDPGISPLISERPQIIENDMRSHQGLLSTRMMIQGGREERGTAGTLPGQKQPLSRGEQSL